MNTIILISLGIAAIFLLFRVLDGFNKDLAEFSKKGTEIKKVKMIADCDKDFAFSFFNEMVVTYSAAAYEISKKKSSTHKTKVEKNIFESVKPYDLVTDFV